MEIWRVESEEGLGMYSFTPEQCSLWVRAADGEFDEEWHPMPFQSNDLKKQWQAKNHIRTFDDYNFGFTGKRQFLQWVYDPEWRKAMAEMRGVVKVYKVDKRLCCVDDHQVMFVKSKAKLIRQFSPDIFDR